jgi:catechol 2,3-dioxygenase-like lactoylglutathione lyase family enzyme
VIGITGLEVLFVAGFGPLVRDPQASKSLYLDTLGLPLEAMPHDPDYLHGEKLAGVRHFALWPLSRAAESCFGTNIWPEDLPIPQSWLEFDVEDVASATEVLKQRGYRILVDCRKEPWGQTVTRLLSPEGILIGITFTPWLRKDAAHSAK